MINKIIQKLKSDHFLKNNFLFFFASLLASFFSYLFYPVIGRIIDISSFGEVQTIVSISAQIGVFVGIFSTVATNIISNNEQNKEEEISELRKLSFYFIIFLSFIFLFFIKDIVVNLKFTSFYPFLGLFFVVIISIFSAFRTSYLQGVKDFNNISIVNILTSILKIIIAFIFVYIGFKSFGAILGISLAQATGLIYLFFKTKNNFKLSSVFSKFKIDKNLLGHLKYGILVLFATSCFTFLYTLDVIIVKKFFSPETAGLFSGISTIARIVIFITIPLISVLFPYIKSINSFQENQRALFKSLILTTFIGGGVLVCFTVFPEFFVNILMGEKYLSFVNYLPYLSVSLFIISLANVFIMYFLALRKYFLIFLSIASFFILFLLTYFFHNSIFSIIYNFIYTSIFIFSFLIISYFLEYIKDKKNTFVHISKK